MPFSGLAPSKLKICSTKIKGRLCVHRGIVCYHFQYGLWGGGVQRPPPWIMGRENRSWTRGLRVINKTYRPSFTASFTLFVNFHNILIRNNISLSIVIFCCKITMIPNVKESRKKVPLLMVRPLRPYPPPLELSGHQILTYRF